MTLTRAAGTTVALLGLASLAAGVARADGPQAVATAASHAGFAASQDNIGGAKTHLHHVLNCLVGPDGEGFDDSVGNPCNSAGGAIPQTADAETREKLGELAAEVRDALASDDAAAVKETAMSVQEALTM